MNATFLVTIEVLDPNEDLASLADAISNKLSNELPIISVKPWARPKTAPSAKSKAVMAAFKTLPR